MGREIIKGILKKLDVMKDEGIGKELVKLGFKQFGSIYKFSGKAYIFDVAIYEDRKELEFGFGRKLQGSFNNVDSWVSEVNKIAGVIKQVEKLANKYGYKVRWGSSLV